MKNSFLLLSAFFLLTFTMCKSKYVSIQDHQEHVATAETLVQIKRSPCFGTCPVDKLIILTDGTVYYQGVKHTDQIGFYHSRLSTDQLYELIELISRFNEAKLIHSKYVMQHVKDLPSRAITISNRTITYQLSEAPEALINLDKHMYETLDRLHLSKIEQTNDE